MYAPGYGYPNAPSTFNNQAPPPNQHQSHPMQQQQHQQQPGSQPGQQQQQHLMYNPNQQFAMPGAQGAAAGSFPGQPNPGMMPGAGPAGMMQNTAMPQMAANGQMAYQNQFPGNAFPGGAPTPAGGQQFPPNYMAGGMPGFPMNQAMTPQQQQILQQRMHQQQQAHQQQQQQQQHHQQQQQHQQHQGGMPPNAAPQRPPSSSQGTPTNAQQAMPQALQHQQHQQQQQQQAQAQQQPTPLTTTQGQPGPGPQQPQSSTSVATPQTPTFPTGGQGTNVNGAPAPTPLSPGTESKEQERFSTLIEINHELLYESLHLQNTIQELKKETAAGDGGDAAKKAAAEAAALTEDYTQCMRRLQGNLAYLAALADRKGNVPVPAHPAYLLAPPLNLSLKTRAQGPGDNTTDVTGDREDRHREMVEQYAKLQSLFPGVDPNKEPPVQQRPQGQQGGGGQAQGPRPPGQQGSP